ncbi:hypothetical protein M431DRAFT_493465 [Trichoderma harzianum CBS 226.95]|uniref:Uncharacterized protein n=1 Tax=Trichoderma harzianum CBS 226.95 TaxID=983964 RepID=A0A2T4AIX8_TRIHA|nr:hypothetical protein M431DRAFT_493465 [Trichoderma harzianum CBS 226.95]PTB56992.1 hypothetical protein M431DRAFT_493465 [Trichoderma harzianum CBS 226.95]
MSSFLLLPFSLSPPLPLLLLFSPPTLFLSASEFFHRVGHIKATDQSLVFMAVRLRNSNQRKLSMLSPPRQARQ